MSVLKRIQIKEVDETSAGRSVVNTDVVFIPGFSVAALKHIIVSAQGVEPTVTASASYDYFYNIIDQKMWKCVETQTGGATVYNWELQLATTQNAGTVTIDSENRAILNVPEISAVTAPVEVVSVYSGSGASTVNYSVASINQAAGTITLTEALASEVTAVSVKYGYGYIYNEPTKENTPVLCETVSDFEAAFGETAYRFTSNQAYPAGFSTNSTTGIANIAQVGDYDKSYIYAKELLYAGVPVLYTAVVNRDTDGVATAPSVQAMYTALETGGIIEVLEDSGEYAVKYITSGGYPVFEYNNNTIVTIMLKAAASRGDATAYIDHTNNPVRSLIASDDTSVYGALTGNYRITSNGEFGTMLTPWASYTCASSRFGTQIMPASFGYFLALGSSLRTNPNWLAIAGVTRGIVPNIISENTLAVLSNTIADSYQSRDAIANINAITNVKPYGLTIWGNRTLKNNASAGNLTATSFLNLRNMVSDIKKVAYTAAKRCLFEQNTDILWINFCSMITPTLDRMNTGAGVSGYKIIKGTTDEKGKVVAVIKIYPIYAIEEFDITVVISDEEVSVS